MPVDREKVPYLPEGIEGLAQLATNLSWSWSRNARRLFAMIDEPLWHLTRHNPIALLKRVSPSRLIECARDPHFVHFYDEAMNELKRMMDPSALWFAHEYADLLSRPVAYFCAEFGLHNSVPIYSGGLGVLAGDHCKAAADLGVPLVGIGLLYTQGYFDQKLRLDGWQEDSAELFEVSNTPLMDVPAPDGREYLTTVSTFGRDIHIAVWRMDVGSVPVFLLDTNLEANHAADRELTSKLYAGGPDVRLRQEWILGVGGVRVLRALGIDPSAWHANEGHAAFMMLERVREYTKAGHGFRDAVAAVRAATVFTTHTPVPAGHDNFSFEQVEKCAGPEWLDMGGGATPLEILGLGVHPVDKNHTFHMTCAALRLARHVNGVAKRHGEVSREIWHPLWPDRPTERVPIGHVTNGVHLSTWMSREIMSLLDAHLGDNWLEHVDDPSIWERVISLDDATFWHIRQSAKVSLLNFIREDARRRWARHWKEATHVVGAGTLLNPDALTIGFARRFATYKRADLVFRDIDRLRALLTHPVRPVQIIFAGKAHPEDTPGKEVLKTVYSFTRDAQLEGRVAFLEDYDLHLSHRLTQGVDLWLNLPRVPLEASGTSGMKAALNGIPQLSTLDGWWHEGYDGLNGWAIPPEASRQHTDDWDADHVYTFLEQEIVPLFYERDERGIPRGWAQRMKHALCTTGQRYTAQRMVKEYVRQSYVMAMRGDTTGDDPPTA